jgi:hypothetical protein
MFQCLLANICKLKRVTTRKRSRGSALIIVLCFVVLLTVVVLAMLSHSLFAGLISGASANTNKTGIYADGAINQIIGDLRQEIVAGSTLTSVAGGATLYRPTSTTAAVPAFSGPTSYSGASAGGITTIKAGQVWNLMPNLLKQSAYEVAFEPYDNSVPQRAANVPTTTASRNGRYISLARWNKALLLPKASAAMTTSMSGTVISSDGSTDVTPVSSFVAPDWILTAADGSNVTSLDISNSSLTSNVFPTSPKFVVGRYAYTIYNEGGLLDANVAGCMNPNTTSGGFSQTATATAARKGPSAFADLTQLPGLASITGSNRAQQIVDSLIGWRNAASLQVTPTTFPNYTFTQANADTYFGYLLGLTTNFLSTGNTSLSGGLSDKSFSTRQELIDFLENSVAQGTSEKAFLQDALSYLGTFSPTLNQPSYWPDPNRPVSTGTWSSSGTGYTGTNSAASPGPAESTYNPPFRSIRVASAFTRNDQTTAVVGEPLVKKRFALNRVAWITPYGPISTGTGFNGSATTIVTYLESSAVGLTDAFLKEGTAANIKAYFGLTWVPGSGTGGLGGYWIYNNYEIGNATNYSLSTIATQNREPDFFELLQAAIKVGGIANSFFYYGNAENTQGYTQLRDSQVIFQTLQIGANIIEDANPTQYPIRIEFQYATGSAPGAMRSIFGATDLPYLYGYKNIAFVTQKPSGTPGPRNNDVLAGAAGTFTIMTVPVIWNPYDTNGAMANGLKQTALTPSGLRMTASGQPLVNSSVYANWSVNDNSVANDSPAPTSPPAINCQQWYGDGISVTPDPTPSTASPSSASVVASTTGLTFQNVSTLYREPTVLWKANSPAGSQLALSSLTSAPKLSQTEAATGTTFYGFVIAQNATYRWSEPSTTPPTVNTYTSNLIGQMGQPVTGVTFRLEYALGPNGPYVPYQEYYEDADEAVAVPWAPTGQTVATPAGKSWWDIGSSYTGNPGDTIDWGTRILFDPRDDRFGTLEGMYSSSTNGPYLNFLDSTETTVQTGRPSATSQVKSWNGYSSAAGWYQSNPSYPVTILTDVEQNLNNSVTWHYQDSDGVLRRASGAYTTVSGADNTQGSAVGLPLAGTVAGQLANPFAPAPNQSQSRPIMLHRPYRSVAELGYVFSGTPWKNVDLSTPESPYSALLDTFCINEDYNADPLSVGRVDLNTRQAPVIQALLSGAYRDEEQLMTTAPTNSLSGISQSEAAAISQDLVTRTTIGGTNPTGPATGPQPLANIADLVGCWVKNVGTNPIDGSLSYDGLSADLGIYTVGTPGSNLIPRFREATMRGLSDAGQAGTWNLFIDLVAQSGRYPRNATGLSDFMVEGERRYWVHVSIDRQTNQVISEKIELVSE